MRLGCPICGTWTVPPAAVGEDGVGGRCTSCDSLVTIVPSETGIAIATARVNAMRAADAKMAAAAT